MRTLVLIFSILSICLASCSRADRRHQRSTPLALSGTAPLALSGSAPLGPRLDSLPSAEPDAGSPLPVVDGPGLLQKIRESGQKGVVINAWASFCDPCREELPMLERVGPKLAALGVPIWLVAVDNPEDYAAAKALLDSLHVDLQSFAAAPPLSDFKLALNPEWPGMIPVSFLFDRTGKLRYFWAGEVYEKELLPVVEGFAQGKHIDGVSRFDWAPGATHGAGHE